MPFGALREMFVELGAVVFDMLGRVTVPGLQFPCPLNSLSNPRSLDMDENETDSPYIAIVWLILNSFSSVKREFP